LLNADAKTRATLGEYVPACSKQSRCQDRIGAYFAEVKVKREERNQDAGQQPAAYLREEEPAMSSQEESVESEIAARDKRAAAVFWWILMAMRMVIPLYVLYAIYLYWTLPPSAYLTGGH
jgi:hypothetical protein